MFRKILVVTPAVSLVMLLVVGWVSMFKDLHIQSDAAIAVCFITAVLGAWAVSPN